MIKKIIYFNLSLKYKSFFFKASFAIGCPASLRLITPIPGSFLNTDLPKPLQ
jgi:hypothetical protein